MWTPQEWRLFLSVISGESPDNDSLRVSTYRESKAHFHLSYVTEIKRFGGKGIVVWGGIMFRNHASLYFFDAGTVNAQRYRDEVLEAYERFFLGAMRAAVAQWSRHRIMAGIS
ncbi:hypothetical protein TNCV_2661191 [Trichonephila clavipes]|nr:hypothetical protein TNCV_2661191 [Trichonephila clavipes]